MKPTNLKQTGGFIHGSCSCGRTVNTTFAYCPSCGVSIDWVLDEQGVKDLKKVR